MYILSPQASSIDHIRVCVESLAQLPSAMAASKEVEQMN